MVRRVAGVTFRYDEQADVFYVSFNTGEPSYSEEVDDVMIMDRGMYSGLITGFRLLDPKKHRLHLDLEIGLLPKIFKQATAEMAQQLDKQVAFGKTLESETKKQIDQLLAR